MNIVTVGRGHMGGGLGKLWREAGHDVVELGRDGGDASRADAVLVAVYADKISEVLPKVAGLKGKIAIDTSNIMGVGHGKFRSYTEEVKSFTEAPAAKSFNWNFGELLDRVRDQRVRPSNVYAADDGAREITEQLIRDAGYDPVYVGDISRARDLEDGVWLLSAVQPPGGVFYRFAPPGQL